MYFVPTEARRYRKNCKKALKLVLGNLTGIPRLQLPSRWSSSFRRIRSTGVLLCALKHRALALYERACAFNACTRSVQQFVGTAKIAKYRKLYPMTEKLRFLQHAIGGSGRHGPGPTLYASACNLNAVSSPKIEKMQSCPRTTATVPSAGHANSDGPQLMRSKKVNLTFFKTQKRNEFNH